MILTATVKLLPTPEQRQSLLHTLETANAACNWISEQAWQTKKFGRVPVHHLTYDGVRTEFGLTAQLVVRCIGKVLDAYKKDRKTKPMFKKHGAIPYDNRILNWRLKTNQVSIWVLGGREIIPLVTGPGHYDLLQYQHGETDLMYRKGEFYLCTTCEVPKDAPKAPKGWLGVDLGIANIATDGDGQQYSGNHVKNVRHRNRRLRARLQSKGTKSAKRKLKRLSGREARFAKDVNHTISKRLVAKAQDTARGIALEDLTHIRSRITVQRAQRTTLHSWSFFQLRAFITYKAQRVGVAVALVDPRNTSRQCAVCGHIDKANRPKQDVFLCTSCGHAAHADVNAAVNIGRRAAVNPPNAVGDLGAHPA